MPENASSNDRPTPSDVHAETPLDDVVLPDPEHTVPMLLRLDASAEPMEAPIAQAEPIIPDVIPVVPGPGFWASLGCLLVLVVADVAFAVAVFLVGTVVLGRRPSAIVLMAAATVGVLLTALALVILRLG